MMLGQPWAEATFGSMSRGDADEFSDRDILIVSDCVQALDRRRGELEANGYSVAAYTWRKLGALSKNGALFIQHLKLESVIRTDDSGRLSELINDFQPKQSYFEELASNRRLFQLVESYPVGGVGSLWCADVLYVALRNFGVLRLAELGKYVFSYQSILDELVNESILDRDKVSALRGLRLAKSLYRSGQRIPGNRGESLLQSFVSAIPDWLLSQCAPDDPHSIVASSFPMIGDASAYHRLRNLEKVFISLSAIDPSICERSEFVRLRRWIENPRAYAGFSVANEGALIARAKRAASDCSRRSGLRLNKLSTREDFVRI